MFHSKFTDIIQQKGKTCTFYLKHPINKSLLLNILQSKKLNKNDSPNDDNRDDDDDDERKNFENSAFILLNVTELWLIDFCLLLLLSNKNNKTSLVDCIFTFNFRPLTMNE